MIDFITNNAPLLFGITAAVLLLIIVLWIVISVRQGNKRREKDFEYNRETEMLKVRISELEKEATTLHERETQLLAERDSILMDAHEKADDILQQTMERIQKSEAQIRQNRIIASCCITDARRRISDLMIEVSKRLILKTAPCSMPSRSRLRLSLWLKPAKRPQKRTLTALPPRQRRPRPPLSPTRPRSTKKPPRIPAPCASIWERRSPKPPPSLKLLLRTSRRRKNPLSRPPRANSLLSCDLLSCDLLNRRKRRERRAECSGFPFFIASSERLKQI